MGFDFFIELCIHLCEETGRPYVYSSNFEKVYELPTLPVVPEVHRRFLKLRGRIFHLYTYDYNEKADVNSILDTFPTWEEVKESGYYEDYTEADWSEADHAAFRAALEWFAKQPFSFQASWSY
jgi:hypothetical protein